jgi:hypothetical protein
METNCRIVRTKTGFVLLACNERVNTLNKGFGDDTLSRRRVEWTLCSEILRCKAGCTLSTATSMRWEFPLLTRQKVTILDHLALSYLTVIGFEVLTAVPVKTRIRLVA